MGLLLFFAVGGIIVALVALSLIAAFRQQASSSRRLAFGGGMLATLYTGALAATNLSAAPRVLSPGQALEFCGVYLDCHLSASVVNVRRTQTLGMPLAQAKAGGQFYFVTIRVASNAKRAELRLYRPEVYVVNSAGHRIAPSESGLSAIRGMGMVPTPLDTPVGPGGSFQSSVVFDLRPGDGPFMLHMHEGSALGRGLESLLLGDDDGLFRPHPGWRLGDR